MYYFRALRQEEIEAGFVLIPKSNETFLAHPSLPIELPFDLGETLEHAIRDHQSNGEYPTRGVSCTTDWQIALLYAQKLKVIATISRKQCLKHSIHLYRVLKYLPEDMIEHPNDKETILVSDIDGPFPKDIIAKITKL